MKKTANLGVFLGVLATSVSGCSKSVRMNDQPGMPGQAAAAPGQQIPPPAPQQSITPTPTPTPSVVISGSPSPMPGSSSSPVPSPSPSPMAIASTGPAPISSVVPVPVTANSPVPIPAPSASPSQSASVNDLLKAKYASAVLSCSLAFPLEDDYRRLGLESLGSDSFTWDLLKTDVDHKNFVLNAKTFRKDLTVNLNVQSVAFQDSVSLKDDQGNAYLLENTPVIQGVYSYESASPISFLRMRSAVLGNGPFNFYEGTDTRLVDEYVGTAYGNASDEYGVLLECVFDTKLKSPTPVASSSSSPTAAE